MKTVTSLACGACLVAGLTSALPARAQVPEKRATTTRTAEYMEQITGGDQVVQFTGDAIAAPPGAPLGGTVVRPPGVMRVGLLRPRLNFVTELLKTVENL
jgi:hypothetical protein